MLKEQREEKKTVTLQVADHVCDECGIALYTMIDWEVPDSYNAAELKVSLRPHCVSGAGYEEFAMPKNAELCSTCINKKYRQVMEALCNLGLEKVSR